MPCFSWIAQDTKKPIRRNDSQKPGYEQRTYFMWDNNGNSWEEPSYEGYGMFGKKDYFILLAEMNKTYDEDVTEEQKRNDGLSIDFSFNCPGIVFPNITETSIWTWKNERP
jgi:hypothetical protein